MNKNTTKILTLTLICLVIFSTVTLAQQEKKDGYFTVVDQEGNTVFQTAMQVHKGDWYIDQNNKKYTIIKINGDQVIAKYEETVDLISGSDDLSSSILQSGILSAEEAKREVAVYNTHSDESYVPSSGTESKPRRGGVYAVADKFAGVLEKKGTKVVVSDAKHTPHDGGAYERSRRTAKKLAQKRPDAMFDIHRDGVPRKSEYLTSIKGRKVGRVRLVVGRQNPGMKSNDTFAKQLKAIADKTYPGLVKGIFYGKGKYNQDIGPRTLIIEAGTHVISREQAEAGATLFADAVDQVLYGQKQQQTQGAEKARTDQGLGALGSLLTILAVVIVAVVGYLIINEGGWEGMTKRIKSFFGEEFTNFLGFKNETKKEEFKQEEIEEINDERQKIEEVNEQQEEEIKEEIDSEE